MEPRPFRDDEEEGCARAPCEPWEAFEEGLEGGPGGFPPPEHYDESVDYRCGGDCKGPDSPRVLVFRDEVEGVEYDRREVEEGHGEEKPELDEEGYRFEFENLVHFLRFFDAIYLVISIILSQMVVQS